MSNNRPVTAPRQAHDSGAGQAALALFLLVFFARAWLIRTWGSPVPYWDQWGAEALDLFRPWLDGTLRWTDLFAPHNEHRIVFTRAADLALFFVNGRWNLWAELLLNAALHAATAATLARLFWPGLDRTSRGLWLLGLAVLFTAPSGWQNALWGFQSQVYFCSLFSVVALGGLLLGEPFHSRWWLGWTAALLALFTQASGVLAAAAALLAGGFLLLVARTTDYRANDQAKTDPSRARRIGLGLLVVLPILALGWVLRGEAPQHASLQARSLGQFGAVFARSLAWPWVNSGWLWLIMQAPLLWFTTQLIRRRHPPSAAERFALGLGLLSGLHAAAIAYSRGAGLPDARPLSRYQDPLLLGVAANLFLLLSLAPRHRVGRPAALIWTGTLLTGLLALTTTNLSLNLPYKRAQDAASLGQIRAYLATHDDTVFAGNPRFPEPLPDAVTARQVLDDPRLLPVLPEEIADPSVSIPRLIKFSPWLVLISLVTLLLVVVRRLRPVKA